MPSPRMALTILLVTSGALLAVPGSASAQPACGDPITEDTVLTEDLICDYGQGAPGPDGRGGEYSLLIGADGVTLDLNGHLVGTENASDAPGIGVFGHSDVTIKNGRSPFITLADTTASRLTGLQSSGWVEVWRSDRSRIVNSTLGGIHLYDSDDNVVRDNTSRSGDGGVTLTRSDRNAVRRNTLCGGMAGPLAVREGSDANLIQGNVVPGCASTYSGGIHVRAQTAGNRLVGNTVFGVRGLPPDLGDPIPAGSGDGIHVESPATTLRGNTANFNDGYGIEAVAGVKSGVNYARGNGNPLQCLNVKCLLRPRALAP
jgi:parallel beta-helix repeat protein